MAKVMSEDLKRDLAKELGVAGTVDKEGWAGVSSRDCGRLIAAALQRAEKSLADANNRRGH